MSVSHKGQEPSQKILSAPAKKNPWEVIETGAIAGYKEPTDYSKEPVDYSALDVINPEDRQKFIDAYETHKSILNRIGIREGYHRSFATYGEFEKAGVDLIDLNKKFKEMEERGLEPQIVISPVLELGQVMALFRDLAADKTIPGNPLKADGNGGYASHFEPPGVMQRYANEIYQSELDFIKDNPDIHSVFIGGCLFTISIIPGTDERDKLAGTYTENEGEYKLPTYSAIAIAEAMRIVGNKPPFDKYKRNLTASSFDSDGILLGDDPVPSCVIGSYWDPDDGCLYFPLETADHARFVGHHGSRRALWG